MEEQLSEAFVRVKSILIDVKKSVQSVPVSNRNLFLPVISDILSEISEVVSSVQQADDVSIDDSDELWWDSSPECVNYSDSDSEKSFVVSTIQFTSEESLSSFSSLSSDDPTKGFISKILSCVSKAAPGNIISRRKYERRREKLMRSLVHPELFSLWQESSQLYEDYKVDYVKPAPLFPTINLREINARALANIPKPKLQPVYGCSNDPKIHTLFSSDGYGCVGLLYGYESIHGIVPVPNHPIHGYIWDHVNGDWILHSDVSSKDPGRGRSHSRNQRG